MVLPLNRLGGSPVYTAVTLAVASLTIALMLTGCAPTYVMQNPKTGEVAQCQSRVGDWVAAHAAETCAVGYEKAGWVRMN
jgi:hypothetical protein